MAKERITRRLKVYTTRIGIHDWAVAVPSQKEALKAWDVRENLFASGAAKVVDDPAVVEAAMKSPGVPVAVPDSKGYVPAEVKSNVVRLEERRAAKAAAAPKKPHAAPAREAKKAHVEHRRAAPPDRSRLDAAEAVLREFDIEIKVRRKELARRRQELERELESFETDAETRRNRLERQLEKARAQFDKLSS
jgi:colicin import membrane protein